MPRAFSQDIAVRVLWQLWWYELESEGVPNQIANEIANGPLAVSAGYVRQVWYRFWWWGTVETHQGRREAHLDRALHLDTYSCHVHSRLMLRMMRWIMM